MPKTPSFIPLKAVGRASKWVVNVPPKHSISGQRERNFFSTKEAAQTYCDQIKVRLANFGAQAPLLKPAQAEQTIQALEKLKPFNVSLNTVVEEWIARRRQSESSIVFEDLIEQFANGGRHNRARSATYRRSILQVRNRLVTLHGRIASEIGHGEIEAALQGMTASVRNFTLRILSCAFNLGVVRGFLLKSPVPKVDQATILSKEIEVYTPAEVANIMRAAEEHSPELIPFFAISFFAGVRRSEVLRMDWTHVEIDERYIRLPKQITKTHQGRHIPIEENLIKWLKPHAKNEGRIVPFSGNVLRSRERSLRDIHSLRVIKHGPRHCFGSYWLAAHENIDRLMLSMGHTDFDTTQEHYAKAVTRKAAQQFWEILPSPKKARKVIPMAVAA